MAQQRVPRDTESDFPRHGDVYDVDLDPTVGSEISKRRPALIVSNDVNNRYAGTVTVLPITGQPSDRSYPFEVLVPKGVAGLSLDSRIKANQVRTVDKRRLVGYRGSLPPQYLPQVEQALRTHLNLE